MSRYNTSGRGGRQGRGRGGRGRGAARFRSTYKQPEIKFYPHGTSGKQQSMTYATVKDAIVQHVQKSFRQAHDIAVSLRDLNKRNLDSNKPTRETSTLTDAAQAKIDQDGKDIDYQAKLTRFLEREDTLNENLLKAYALIFSNYCSKTIQNRIEEHPDFESVIRDDPIELLKAIKVLMHETARARYPLASLTDAFTRLINLRQMEHENLLDYVKRFKQNRDVMKSHVGNEILY